MQLALKSLDARIRSVSIWRVGAIVLCIWIAGVIGYASFSAYNDGLELYRWTMLGLLLVGLPVGLLALVYAAVLLGRKGRTAAIVLLVAVAVSVAALRMYNMYQARVRADERRAAQLIEEREMAKRVTAKQAQDAEDFQKFGATCTAACQNLGNFSEACSLRCSQNRGDVARRAKWDAEKATCATQCAAVPNPYCDIVCDREQSESSR